MLRGKKFLSVMLSALLTVGLTGICNPLSVNADTTTESNYNYGEALQKAVMFYEFQRSGKLPSDKRDNWRSDSAMNDGKDVGLDLTGGWYDCGDHVKFNLPASYTATMLAWSVYEDKDGYEKSGQLKYIMDDIKWANDYFIKCHPEADVYYYQVGEPGADHKWWGPPEVMQMERPSYKLDINNPGTTVCAETAASLASAAIIFKDSDPDYSATCLKHSKELLAFAEKTLSDTGYKAASTYYNTSGFYDELSWASTWLYMATNDQSYLDKAEGYVSKWPVEQQTTTISYTWGHCWDDVHYGAQLLLAKLTNKDIYKESTERNLDFWTTGCNGRRVTYTPKGLAWLSNWGSLRYATTTAFLAGVYADWSGCTPSKVATYKNFLDSQVNYALGSTGRSFEIGFGVDSPKSPHHRGAQASWWDKSTVPNYHRHLLYGALVGGPDASDKYTDSVEDFTSNEVGCDYNAGFVCSLAKMYKKYGGDPIPNFKSIEEKTNDEYYVEASVNNAGPNYMEIKALLYNKTGWPAKVGDKLSFKYFIDISELVKAGYTAKDITVTTNYNDGAKVSQLIPWDESKNIYYVNADFTGTKIYPGGQSAYRKEIQFRMAGPQNTNIWDNSNDFSYNGVNTESGGTPVQNKNIPVYDDGVLVYGNTPEKKEDPTKKLIGDVNDDKVVNVVDYSLLQRYIKNPTSVTINTTNADINGDTKVTVADLLALRKIIINS